MSFDFGTLVHIHTPTTTAERYSAVGERSALKESSDVGDEMPLCPKFVTGRVLWSNGDLAAVEIEDSTATVAVGNVVSVHFEECHTFLRQMAEIEDVIDREFADFPTDCSEHSSGCSVGRRIVVFRGFGERKLAENRDCYRVQTKQLNLFLEFGSVSDCEIVDMSQTGFGIVSPEVFSVGDLAKATLPGPDGLTTGIARIQSVRSQSVARFRYGVIAIGSELRDACSWLTMQFQRRRLRRLAGHRDE